MCLHHMGSLWLNKGSHDFQPSRIGPFWHRPLALGALHWPALDPYLSPGAVRALEFLWGLLSAGNWQQLRAYQMPGWWVPSKHIDRQFLWFCFFVYTCKIIPDSSSAPSALRNIWSPDGQREPQEDIPTRTHGNSTELWLRTSVPSPVFISLGDLE